MTSVSRAACLKIYKDLQQTASKFPQYNYRSFARRRIRDHFEANKSVTDEQQKIVLYEQAKEALASLKRQVGVSAQFPSRPLVIETQKH